MDAVIKIIRGSGSRAEAKENLLAAKYKIVDKAIQAKVGGAEGSSHRARPTRSWNYSSIA